MRKVAKCIISLVAVAILFILIADFSANADELEPNVSMQDVKESLAEDEQALEEFNNLSTENKELFVNAMNDPEVFKENLEITLEDENFAVTPNFASASYSIAAASSTRVIKKTRTYAIGLAGVKITNYSHILRFEARNNRATKILENTAMVAKNYNPMVKSGLKSKASYVTGGKAYANAYFYYNIGPLKGVSVEIGTLKHTLVVNGTGSLQTTKWQKL